MMILSACYRRREGRAVPLLLQQYQYKGIQVLFACVFMSAGEGTGGYMAQQLLEWFRRLDPEKLIRSRGKSMDKLSDSLAGLIRRIDGELENRQRSAGEGKVGFAGIFCLGDHYLMLHRGTQRIYLLNTAFNRVYAQRLYKYEAGGEYVEQGRLQPDVGLLFATESFYENISDTMIKEGLGVGEAQTEEQMGRHLKELVEEGARRGSFGIGAVYLRTI